MFDLDDRVDLVHVAAHDRRLERSKEGSKLHEFCQILGPCALQDWIVPVLHTIDETVVRPGLRWNCEVLPEAIEAPRSRVRHIPFVFLVHASGSRTSLYEEAGKTDLHVPELNGLSGHDVSDQQQMSEDER